MSDVRTVLSASGEYVDSIICPNAVTTKILNNYLCKYLQLEKFPGKIKFRPFMTKHNCIKSVNICGTRLYLKLIVEIIFTLIILLPLLLQK